MIQGGAWSVDGRTVWHKSVVGSSRKRFRTLKYVDPARPPRRHVPDTWMWVREVLFLLLRFQQAPVNALVLCLGQSQMVLSWLFSFCAELSLDSRGGPTISTSGLQFVHLDVCPRSTGMLQGTTMGS